MKYFILFITALFIAGSCTLPKPTYTDFEGRLVYTIESDMNIPDMEDSINYQVIYAKDSMLRIDNFTPIGKQVYIQHIPKNRAYILMDLGMQKVAIQTIPDTTLTNDSYVFTPQAGKQTIAGLKCNKIKVKDLELDTTLTMYYYPEISPKYSTAMRGMPGLPVEYSLFSSDTWFTYRLQTIEETELNIDLFGIPSDHQIITLDQFIEMIEEAPEE